MHVTQDHRLARTRQCASPNQDPRPDPEDISLLVIHNISLPPGRFGTGLIEEFFLNRLDTGREPGHRAIDDLDVEVLKPCLREHRSTSDEIAHSGTSDVSSRNSTAILTAMPLLTWFVTSALGPSAT